MTIEKNKIKKSLIVAGTYEKLLYGLNFEENSETESSEVFQEDSLKSKSVEDHLKSVKDQLHNSSISSLDKLHENLDKLHENLDFNLEEEKKVLKKGEKALKKGENDVDTKSVSGGKELVPSFIYPTHLSSISCLSMGHSKYLATGSSDENIKLYDLKLRKEIGNLMIHTDTITRLQFIGKSHLISSSRDGTIGITRSSDWELLKKLKGHMGAVLDFSIHSSGKVLLSVGQDSTLKCWDLSRGLLSYSMKLPSMPTMVRWSTCGSRYLVFSDNQISIYSILQTGDSNVSNESPIVAKIQSKSRINCGVCMKMNFHQTTSSEKKEIDVVVYGGEDKIVRIACITTGRILLNLATKHQLRIKDMAGLPVLGQITTCSSEGLIQIWDLEKLVDKIDLEATKDSSLLTSVDECADSIVGQFDCKCRVTCISFINGDTGEDRRQAIEKEKKVQADRVAKLNEIPESDYEGDVKKAKAKKVSVAFDSDNTLQVASPSDSTSNQKKGEKSSGKITLLVKEKNFGGVSKKKKVKSKKPKLQREE